MRSLVLYHAGCADGFCSAWVAHRQMPDAEFVPVQYGEEPPDVAGRDVYVLDFSYKRPVLAAMARAADCVVVLDHHKTAAADLDPTTGETLPWNCRVTFDMDKSGGRLTWEYFFLNQPTPWLVDYTEDRDLWRWKLEESREVSACLASWSWTFDEWDKLALDGTAVPHFATEGAAILRYQQQQVNLACANAKEMDMDGHKILAVNATTLSSEIAGKLAEGRPFGATFFITSDNKQVWSLRSRDGGVDVSEIAKRHGGGGHRNAAGFKMEV